MDKKILGIIIICIFFLIIYKKESFISTGLNNTLKNNVDNKNVSKDEQKEKIIEESQNVTVPSTQIVIVDQIYSRIFGVFVGIMIFIYVVINYKRIFNYIKSFFIINNDSNDYIDEYDELNSFGGKDYYMPNVLMKL